MPRNKCPSGLFIGIKNEDCFESNNITNPCDSNISFQDCTALQDHLLHLRHNNDKYNKYFRSSENTGSLLPKNVNT